MTDKNNDNVINFPRGKQPQNVPSSSENFLDAIKQIKDGSIAPKKNVKKRASPSQKIEGDKNIQVGSAHLQQSIKGHSNVQVGGSVSSLTVHSGSKATINLAPAVGSIGANPSFRFRIEELVKEINDYRYQRLGNTFNFRALYGELGKAFGFKPSEWKKIWLCDESLAPEVIKWLEGKRDNTIQGRIKKATKGEGYKHSRGHLFRIESDYLKQLGWDEKITRDRRKLITGAASRKDITDVEFQNWVGYLRRELNKMYGETE
ncbi:hypothetical protein AABH71_003158 [Salmonella enterica]|uniref:Uncharacterized protein n=1 Tax=Salmonella enterica I TaxID=59201 RepID=A0A403QKT7_SALET|nr:hypothetical protein [Salmonella enterica subsp. enterica serovar Kokomlemle]EEB7409776.1 hypothetical protein [Salmonella enterica]EGJ5834701.1 hypothetical protein [Salmonella enterica]MML55218.1 hypothetical protein [Salmonella enterica subsp. enterica serovar Kidderminster]